RSWAVLVVAALLLASVGWVYPQLGFQFQPSVDSGFLEIRVDLPQGSTLDNSNLVAQRLERELLAEPAIEHVQTTVGSGGLTGNSVPESIYIIASLVERDHRELSTDNLRPVLQERLTEVLADRPEIDVSVSASDAGLNLSSAGVSIGLGSLDRNLLQERAERLLSLLNTDR